MELEELREEEPAGLETVVPPETVPLEVLEPVVLTTVPPVRVELAVVRVDEAGLATLATLDDELCRETELGLAEDAPALLRETPLPEPPRVTVPEA